MTIISRRIVPAALAASLAASLLLAGFSNAYVPLIIGTNLGGLGTLIASMASLVTYKHFTKMYPNQKGKYLKEYTSFCALFVLVLFGLSCILE